MKKMLSLLLVFCLVLPLTVSAESRFEQAEINPELQEYIKNLPTNERNQIQEKINEPLLTNLNELSKENKEIVVETVKDTKNLVWAMVYEEKPVMIYKTIDDKVYVSITEGNIEVISFIKDNIMTVNDVDIAYELEITESTSLVKIPNDEFNYGTRSSYVHISNPGGVWSYMTTRNGQAYKKC